MIGAMTADRLIAVGQAAHAAELVRTEVVKAEVSNDLLVNILSGSASTVAIAGRGSQ